MPHAVGQVGCRLKLDRNAPRSHRSLVSRLLAVAAILGLASPGCAPRAAVERGPAEFPALTEGTPETLAAHLDGLKYRFDNTPVSDPRVARTNLDAYSKAVLETATPIWENPAASNATKRKAAEMILQALKGRLEFEDDALDTLLSWIDRFEAESPEDSPIRPMAALIRYDALNQTLPRIESDPEVRTDRLIDAALRLGRTRPVPEKTESILDQLGNQALQAGREDRALKLFSLEAELYPDSPLGARAAGIARRLEGKGKLVDDLAGKSFDDVSLDVKDYRGKVVLVMFWGTDYQEPGKLPLDLIRTLRARYGEELAVLGILFDESLTRARNFFEREKIDWPNIYAPIQFAGDQLVSPPLAVKYGVETSPYFLLLDRDGRMVTNGQDLELIRPELEALFATSNGSPAESPAPSEPNATEKTAEAVTPPSEAGEAAHIDPGQTNASAGEETPKAASDRSETDRPEPSGERTQDPPSPELD